ncbi:MAG: flagellar motor switch phosphatase FliY [Oscillospiraceae bacterium]|jgi:flagellar motor switch protein FliN/FliY|nr:flagellar motor switch phosphatase FliY [Oscillospiraceae bacterium]
MSEEKLTIDGFGDVEMDAIGEIMNITMGSAATAVSNMLSAKVWITTPQVKVIRSEDLSFPELEPSIMVKIKYTQGVSGENVLVLKQNDVQLILNQLMGLPLEVSDDFQFDEMNISAVCEVMNQMMGASATALSEIIETTVDISTPEAVVQEGGADAVRQEIYDLTGQDFVCTVKFDLTIDGVIKSEFISVLTISLAKEMADKMMTGYNNIMDSIEEAEPAPAPAPAASSAPAGGGASMSQEQIEAMMGGGTAPQPAAPQMPQQPVGAVPMPGAPAAGAMPQMPYGQPMDPNMAAMYGGYPPQGMYPQMPMQPAMPPMNVQPVQLQNFAAYQNANLNQDQNDNLKLLMNVPLNVTVEIGSAVKKVKEILDFSQGTIIELERQAGAPVDIIVNGNLIAKGDVVVIDDNFAVRITEIIKSKFLESLGGKE